VSEVDGQTGRIRITVVDELEMLYRAAAELFVQACVEAVEARGRFTVALAGGSTPKGLYTRLATDERLRTAVPWEKGDFFWGDERHVPPDHADSNHRMAHDAMLSRVPVVPARVHRVHSEQPDAAVAAILYEVELRRSLDSYGGIPRFDLLLLGLGADGHTASLFPGTDALSEQSRLVVANRVPALNTTRITMTFPLLNAARRVMFLVAGAEKAEPVRDILQPGPAAPELPARRVQPPQGTVDWLLDRTAAALLTSA
jgi:6-phosphogluconolactonase